MVHTLSLNLTKPDHTARKTQTRSILNQRQKYTRQLLFAAKQRMTALSLSGRLWTVEKKRCEAMKLLWGVGWRLTFKKTKKIPHINAYD